MKIHFILVEPIVPENVGASARAIKTMGFDSLRLVNPCDHLNEKALWLAHASSDILNNAKIFETLEEAVCDTDFVIGTTAKRRSVKHDYYPGEQIPLILKKKKNSISSVAIVFGREESGLTNSEIQLCDIVTFIPMKTAYPSLNLSQAVMLYAYTLSKMTIQKKTEKIKMPVDVKYTSLVKKVKKILIDTKVSKNQNIYNRIFERIAVLYDDDINLLLSVCSALSKNIETGDNDKK